MNVAGCAWTENLRPYLRFLASLTGCELTEAELAEVETCLEGTDAEHGYWTEYVLSGPPEITLTLTYEVGYDNVQIQFEADEQIGLPAEKAMQLLMQYSLHKRHA